MKLQGRNLAWVFVAAAQLLFFVIWGLQLRSQQGQGREVWLEPIPVDPRDLWSGKYVALSYAIQTPTNASCKRLLISERTGQQIFVKMSMSTKPITAAGVARHPLEVAECRQSWPAAADRGSDFWVKGRITNARFGGTPTIQFGIERFYLPEADPLLQARPDKILVQGRILTDGTLRIDRLVQR